MTDQKAKEWVEEQLTKSWGSLADSVTDLRGDVRQEMEAAYRAGYQAGLTDAHRKEWVQEMPTEFSRGLT